jgi:hypothetical protein
MSSLMPQTLYICMSQRICSEMNAFIRFESNDRRRFISNVGIFAIAVAFSFSPKLSFGALTMS